MKKTKKQTEERLLKELQLRDKKAKLAPDRYSCKVGGTLLTGPSYTEEIRETMVELHDVDEDGFLYIKINPKTPQDIRNILVGKAIDEYPAEVLAHKSKHPGLTMKEFIWRYYTPITMTSFGPFRLPHPVMLKGKSKKPKTALRKKELDILKEGERIFSEVEKGKSLLQIAKERSGINKNPSYDYTVNREYQKVKRYYKKFKETKG